MAEYRFNKDGSLRTSDYVFTVSTLDDPQLKELRKTVSKHNAEVRKVCRRNKWNRGEYHANELKRVRIMPRGSRVDHSLDNYGRRRAYDSYLPMEYGDHFDVYVGTDHTARYVMQRELQTGLTPGMQAKINRLQSEIYQIQAEGHARMVY